MDRAGRRSAKLCEPHVVTSFASGANYSVDLDEEVAIVKVWKRPDLSFDEGARLAAEIAAHLTAIVEGHVEGIRAIVLDLRTAHELIGKKTRDAIGEVLLRAEGRNVRFAIVIGSPTQAVLVERVTKDAGRPPGYVLLSRDYDDACSWAAEATRTFTFPRF